jgi:hypothetical protein
MNSTIFNHNTGFNVSSKYKAINTASLVSQFEAAGFQLNRQSVARVRDVNKQGYQKHLLVFRHPTIELKSVGDSVPEILLKNSYDGSSSFQLMLGIYRMVCSNGLIVGSTYKSVRVRHVGQSALDNAINGAFQVAQQASEVANDIQAMQSILLTNSQQHDFAVQATQLIMPETAVQFDTSSLLAPRRYADNNSDLWSVFNRVQENIIRGGSRYTTVDANNRIRNRTRRAVRAIDKNVTINRALWTIADSFLTK